MTLSPLLIAQVRPPQSFGSSECGRAVPGVRWWLSTPFLTKHQDILSEMFWKLLSKLIFIHFSCPKNNWIYLFQNSIRETCHKTRIVAGCGPFNPAEDLISCQRRKFAFLTWTRGERCAVFSPADAWPLQASQWRESAVRPSFAILVCLFDIFRCLRLFSEFLEQKIQEKL